MRKAYVVTITAALAACVCAGSGIQAQTANVQNPHKNLSRECEVCHTPASFNEILFDHDATRFTLVGRHEDARCLLCHSIEDFTQVDGNCVACHEDVHLQRLGASCDRCHTPRDWIIVDSDEIHSETDFPLVGRHVLLDCETCHRNQQPADFSRTPSRCIDCHQIAYLQAASPNHVANGFSTQCNECHHPTSWRPATMPDHDALFPIFSGTHRSQWDACVVCHTDSGNPSFFNCLSCHDHNRTLMDTTHQGIGGYTYQSAACYNCHPTGEAGAFVDHDAQFFPIYSGKHSNEWDDCLTCHTAPANKKIFTCLQCHEHNRTKMDDKHLGEEAEYTYTSAACLDCHPDGRK